MATTYKKGESAQRKWGSWQVLLVENDFVVKSLRILPGEKTSLQSHSHRSECLVVAAGAGVVTRGEEKISVATNDMVFLPVECKHRVENTGDSELIIIETQTGDLLDENDIIRYDG